MIGQTVGKYRVIERVGRGGMGTVYRAVDDTLQRDVAIKVLNPELNDPEVATRFKQEAVTVARANHPGIATVYELFQHETQWVMVMEFVRGETLEGLVTRVGPLPVAQAAQLLVQALSAIGYAHRLGIIHRDLKPANIMVTEDGHVKVMDFGIARVVGTEHLTGAGLMMGTPAYMAPEQVLAKPVDSRADLYAMGVVLYRLTTARLPFKGDTAFLMAQSQINDPPTPIDTAREGLAPWLSVVIERALAKDPEQRYQSAEEFRITLERHLASAQTDAIPIPAELQRPPAGPVIDTAPPRPALQPPTPLAVPAAPQTAPVPIPHFQETIAPQTAAQLAAAVAPTIPPTGSIAPPVASGPESSAVPPPAPLPAAALPPRPSAPRASSSMVWVGVAAVLALAVGGYAMFGGSDEAPVEQDPLAASPPPAVTEALAPAEQVRPTPTQSPSASVATTPAAPATPAIPAPVVPAETTPPPAPAPAPAAAPAATPAGRPAEADTMMVFRDVRLLIVTGTRGREQEVMLNLAEGRVSAVARQGTVIKALPYTQITHITYSRSDDPRWQPGPGAPPDKLDAPGGFLGRDRHWLTIQSNGDYLILRLDGSNWERVISALEARTGLTTARPARGR